MGESLKAVWLKPLTEESCCELLPLNHGETGVQRVMVDLLCMWMAI